MEYPTCPHGISYIEGFLATQSAGFPKGAIYHEGNDPLRRLSRRKEIRFSPFIALEGVAGTRKRVAQIIRDNGKTVRMRKTRVGGNRTREF
ncbi:hypothetical protein CDAR_13871 [Caerostris darwini]|uniref:Uncharacterized protein n=1 Tax=Caerostris darwini TaxID=1538125 RepID=A0AAV4VWW7_9ARAC|nr:hypothetical protein CDAR_13871 [Caerostris darwini]